MGDLDNFDKMVSSTIMHCLLIICYNCHNSVCKK